MPTPARPATTAMPTGHRTSGGPLVAVELAADTPVGLLRLLGIVPPRMVGGAAATARVVAP